MLSEIFESYFIEPILSNSGYNPVNTLVYSIIFACAILSIYYMFDRKFRIKFDTDFFIAILPFIFFSSALRVLEDAKIVSSIFLISPLAYITIFSIFFLVFVIAWIIQKKFAYPYQLTLFSVGSVLFLLVFSLFTLKTPLPFILQLFLFSPAAFGLFLLSKTINFFKGLNGIALSSQIFDGFVTFLATSFFGRIEQHFLPRFLILQVGAWTFPLAKVLITIFVLLAIDRYFEDENFRNFLKIIVCVLGFGQGGRDLLSCMVV